MQDLFTETKELTSLKIKLQQISEVLQEILCLAPSADWNQVSSAISVLTAKYESVVEEIEGFVFKSLLVHPHTLPPEDPDFVPRILLRTKLIPELEQAYLNTMNSDPQKSQEIQDLVSKNASLMPCLYATETELEQADAVIDFAQQMAVDELVPEESDKSRTRISTKPRLEKTLSWISSGVV